MSENMKFCHSCGKEIKKEAELCVGCGVRQPGVNNASTSNKNRLAALLLCWFLGVFGVHRFYLGKVGSGIAQFLTFGGLGFWALIDFIRIACGSFRDYDNKRVLSWN